MQKNFSFTFDSQEHEAFIIGKELSVLPNFVLIHGGGFGAKERVYTYSAELEKHGVTMLAFDQSGAGKDAVNIKESSLKRRADETAYAIEHFTAKERLTICGSSMGGEIALRMLEKFDVKSLILFCPAVYDTKAFTIKFGEGFTDIIRKQDSWQNAISLKILEKFTGKLLILIGGLDTVIPEGVIQALDAHSQNVSHKEIYRIPGCPHRYQDWLNEHPDELKKVQQKVIEYSI